MTKALTPTEKSKKQRENITMPPKTSIAERLRTGLGKSVGETTAKRLETTVRLNYVNYIGRFKSWNFRRLRQKKDVPIIR